MMIIENTPSNPAQICSTLGRFGPNELYSQAIEQTAAATIEKFKKKFKVLGDITVRK